MNWKLIFIGILLVGLLVAVPVRATTVIINCSRDGQMVNNPADQNTTFGTLHGDTAATTTTDPLAAGSTLWVQVKSATTPSTGYDLNTRSIISFPTSTLPDLATISAATVNLYSSGGQSSTLVKVNASLIDAEPASHTDFGNGDYDGTTFTRQANDILYDSIPAANGTVAFALTNLTFINKTGNTAYILTHDHDVDNVDFTWASNKQAFIGYRSNSYAGTPYSPINITITYTAPPTAVITTNVSDGNAPLIVQFTDMSTETPTGWNWSFGDGSAVVTTRDPAHTYTTPGIYTVTFNSTNDYGVSSDVTTRICVIDPLGWNDTFTTNTSSYYKFDSTTRNFTWDTTNGFLNSSTSIVGPGTGEQLYYTGSPFFNGTYSINITPVKWVSEGSYYYTEFLFGSQSQSSGTYYSDSVPKYAVYFKKDPDVPTESIKLSVVRNDGSHEELVTYNHLFAEGTTESISIVWNPYSATNVINVSLNGSVIITSNNKEINTSGWAGPNIHGNAGQITRFDDFRINNNTADAVIPTTSFTKSRSIVRVPQTVTFTDTSTNTPTSWNWSLGDGTYNTSRNHTHSYTKAGKYTVSLTATNAAGSDVSDTQTVKVYSNLEQWFLLMFNQVTYWVVQ